MGADSLRAELLRVIGGTDSPFRSFDQQQYQHQDQQQHKHPGQQQSYSLHDQQEYQPKSTLPVAKRATRTWQALQRRLRRSDQFLSVGGLSLLTVFPRTVAMWAGVMKLVVGALMAVLGGVGIVVEAALCSLGGGLWAGSVVGLSGFLAVCASRQPLSQVSHRTLQCAGIISQEQYCMHKSVHL